MFPPPSHELEWYVEGAVEGLALEREGACFGVEAFCFGFQSLGLLVGWFLLASISSNSCVFYFLANPTFFPVLCH